MDSVDLRDPEARIGVAAAGKLLGVAPVTAWRWCRRGVLVRGERVRLEALRLGGRLITSFDAVQRFIDRLNAPADTDHPDDDPDDAIRTPRSRRGNTAQERRQARRAVGLRTKGEDA